MVQLAGDLQTDVPYLYCGADPSSYARQRDLWGQVSGAVWWICQAAGAGAVAIPDHGDFGQSHGRKHGGSERWGGPISSDCGSGLHGFWSHGPGYTPMSPGGPTILHLCQPSSQQHITGESIFAPCRPKMDHMCTGLLEGNRCHQCEARRDAGIKVVKSPCRRRSPKSKTKAKGGSKEEVETKAGRSCRGRRALRGGERPSDEGNQKVPVGLESNPLEAEIDFCTWALCIPRWVLRTRTEFSWKLKQSFSVRWCESVAAPTTTFPLPVPHPGCFAGGGPGLPRRQLLKVAKRRLLHVIIYVLNYLFLGRFPVIEEIQRRPNKWQLACFSRLYAVLDVCGNERASYPMVPGRSGPELGAELFLLEKFVESRCGPLQPYHDGFPKKFARDRSHIDLEKFPELMPYKPLDASRLRLVGSGKWRMEDHLHGPFWPPFVEPRFLLHGDECDPAEIPRFDREDRAENLRLAKLWDAHGLLRMFRGPLVDGHFSRVFNCHKNRECDRQIGDRRLPDGRENHINGPSKFLPPGHLLCNLRVCPYLERLRCSVTDRRDFYHQCGVSEYRARSNMLPFQFSEDEVSGFNAASFIHEAGQKRKSKDRHLVGDGFGEQTGPVISDGWYAAFGAVFQGDHLGVEFALEAHEDVLRNGGLLCDDCRLRGHHPLPLSGSWEALIIDDYFFINREPIETKPLISASFGALAQARAIYEKHGILGSDEKDIVAADSFKAAGAEVISNDFAIKKGLTLVGSPIGKRIALSSLSLRACRLPCVSSKLVARMAGNWVSSLLFRRPLSSIVEGFFALAADAEERTEDALVPFGAGVRQEVAMLAVMAPLMATNAAVTYQRNLFATDASLGLGAIVKTRIEEELSEVLWLGSDKKGTYSRFDQPVQSLLCAVGEEKYEDVAELAQEVPQKAPLLYFDFVEFYGGAGIVSRCASEIGLSVAPPLDLDASVFYDFTSLRLLEWCLHMVESGRFRSFLAEPPCTTFSAAAHPACRSYKEPLGFSRTDPKTLLGNTLAFRSFILLRTGKRCRRPCGLEQPRRSKLAWTRHWRMLLEEGFSECILASCQFGSIHKKEFVFLFFLLNSEAMQTKCPGGHAHVKIEGRFTRPSAVYVRDLAMHVAKGFRDALVFSDLEQVSAVQGFESVVVNDALISCRWEEERSWFWKKKAHINELEISAATSLVAQQAREHPGSRFCNIVDSRVSLGALAKGRSSSRCLNRSCRRVAALVVAGDLYPGWLFGPTRLNVADDPTRLVPIRTPSTSSIQSLLTWHQVHHLHACHLPRYLSGWVRLFLLIGFLPAAEGFSPSSFCFDCWTPQWSVFRIDCWTPQWSSICFDCWTPQWSSSCFDCWAPQWNNLCFGCWTPQWINLYFDCWTPQWMMLSEAVFPFTFWRLPVFSSWSLAIFRCLGYLLSWISSSLIWCSLLLMLGFSLSLAGSGVRCTIGKIPLVILTVAAAPLQPCSHVEQQRAATRSLTDLVASRVVRPETRASRDALLQEFQVWLYEDQGISLSVLLTAKPPDAEEICRLLVEYGKQMFAAGRAYGKYAETINAIGAARPFVKKHLTQAWDLAFAWLADEPGQHHPALPLSVLLSITSVALMWGWVFEAGAICLAWCGILRIGEVFLAQRRDLILPCDSMPGIHFILLKIKLPKTRGRSAKHQAARVDPIDIVELLTAIYADLPSDAPLWPFSASTLRKRFNSLLEALNLDTKKTVDGRPFGLGSLRAGGATHLLLETENPDLVRRRGRWLAHRKCICRK